MKSFSPPIDIQAPVDKIWRILINLPTWPQWNSTVERTAGNIERGAKVTVFVKQGPGRAFPLRVTAFDAPHRMVWAGGMPFGLFKGTRVYELTAPTAAASVFSMREDYTGPLAGLIARSALGLTATGKGTVEKQLCAMTLGMRNRSRDS
jgi:uncharacterized protein YndB with AHSA1/START domain